MNRLKEFFMNIPIFQRRVEREIENKGIKPTKGIKQVEHGRQMLRRAIISVIIAVSVVSIGLSYFEHKNGKNDTLEGLNETFNSYNEDLMTYNTSDFNSETVKPNEGYLLRSSAEKRSEDAIEAFEEWYESFSNNTTALEINEELLKPESSEVRPIDLQQTLISNLRGKFGDKVTEDFFTGLQESFEFNPIVIDNQKGLTIIKQNENESYWLGTWLLDAREIEGNTQIILRNDFPFEWVDWRNEGRKVEYLQNIFIHIDWDNDLSYEVVGVTLKDSIKKIDTVQMIAILMHYNDYLGKWQISGSIGGVL